MFQDLKLGFRSGVGCPGWVQYSIWPLEAEWSCDVHIQAEISDWVIKPLSELLGSLFCSDNSESIISGKYELNHYS